MISAFTLSDRTSRTNRRAGQLALAKHGISGLFVSNKQTLLLLHSHHVLCNFPVREREAWRRKGATELRRLAPSQRAQAGVCVS